MDADIFERWPELDGLFERALETPEEERDAFLAAACEDRPELRRALETLLATHAEADDFLEDWAAVLGEIPEALTESDATAEPSLEGQTIGHLEILERLGSGGMGVAYKARDTRLDRLVTLKFLRPHLVADEGAKARFVKEARAASALDHANICTIHDIAESDEGRLYISMAYYAGETLEDRLARGPLGVDESLDIARQLAAGLQRAHAAGIVHRDLKPANIMITEHGEVKILDFGIAKLEGASDLTKLTKTGHVLGTLTYMSPEQARGAEVDHRADQWALGVVLYEMLSGHRPFDGQPNHVVMYAILEEEPPSLSALVPAIPAAVEQVVQRTLSKRPDHRFTDMAEVEAALLSETAPLAAKRRRPALVRLAAAGVLIAAVALPFAFLTGDGDTPGAVSDAPPTPAVAVLPFSISGAGLGDWREGLVTLLSTGLDGAGGLRSVNSRTVFARVGERSRAAEGLDQAASMRVAREAGAAYAVLGSAVAIGPEVRLVADIYDTDTGALHGQRQVQGHPDSVLTLVDRLAVGILSVIFDRNAGELPPVRLASITTRSVPALKAFLDGEVYARRSHFDEAIAAYRVALAEDSTFALAHYHLASTYAWAEGIQSANTRRHRQAALDLVDRLPEREAALVRARHATGEQWAEAVALLTEAVRRHPDDAEAWFLLGDAHLHTGALTPPADADQAFQRAVALDPEFALYQPHGIELGLNHLADSAIATARLEHYGDITNRTAWYPPGRFAVDAVFGTPELRASMLAAIDTFSLGLLPAVSSFVQHPRHWEVQERVYLAIRDRDPPSGWRSASADFLAAGALWKRGHLDRGLAYLAHPEVSAATRVCFPAVAKAWDVPIPEDILVEAMSSRTREEPLHAVIACQGYIAADLGRWDRHAALVSEAEERADAARRAGHLDQADRMDAAATELRGYELWRRGRPTEALPVLQRAREATAWYLGVWPRRVHKKALWYPDIWAGFIHLELEAWDEAAPHFRRPWYNALAELYQARIQREIGNEAAMRAAAEYFLEAWQDADPIFQPWVEEARRMLEDDDPKVGG